MGSGFKSRKTIKRSSQSLGNRPLESNGVMTFYNGVLSSRVFVQERSLFHQDDHLISRSFHSRDKKLF